MPSVRGFFKSLKVLELLIILQIQPIIVYSENSVSTQTIKWSLSSPQLKLLLSCSTPKYSYCQGGDLVHANILDSFFIFVCSTYLTLFQSYKYRAGSPPVSMISVSLTPFTLLTNRSIVTGFLIKHPISLVG
jgi:hypothetical protein